MNSDFVMQQSKLIAERANEHAQGDAENAIARCFELILGRQPTSLESQACTQVASKDNLESVCRALINSNEFAFLP